MYDAAQKLATLKQTDHDMVACVSKAQSALEELKLSLQADKLEDMKKKLDNRPHLIAKEWATHKTLATLFTNSLKNL